jgi:hypothetical protein
VSIAGNRSSALSVMMPIPVLSARIHPVLVDDARNAVPHRRDEQNHPLAIAREHRLAPPLAEQFTLDSRFGGRRGYSTHSKRPRMIGAPAALPHIACECVRLNPALSTCGEMITPSSGTAAYLRVRLIGSPVTASASSSISLLSACARISRSSTMIWCAGVLLSYTIASIAAQALTTIWRCMLFGLSPSPCPVRLSAVFRFSILPPVIVLRVDCFTRPWVTCTVTARARRILALTSRIASLRA